MEIEYKTGVRRKVSARIGNELIRRGIAYQTRELRAESTPNVDETTALRAALDKRGIKYHHRAGPATLRKLLEG